MSFPSPGSTFTYHEPGKGTYQGFVETYVNGRARVRNGHDCRIRYLEANEVEKIKESPTKCSENLNRDILTSKMLTLLTGGTKACGSFCGKIAVGSGTRATPFINDQRQSIEPQ